VTNISLFMGQDKFGNQISLGKARVSYSTKEEAAKAQQALHFEEGLGKMILIDFYKSKQLLMQEHKGSTEIE
jgi:selenophosphate synthase